MEIDFSLFRRQMDRIPIAKFNLEKARARATSTTMQITDMPKGGGGNDKMARNVENIIRAKENLAALMQTVDALRDSIRPYITKLDKPLQRLSMSMRYLEGYSVRDIAFRLNYSEQHIFYTIKSCEQLINQQMETDRKNRKGYAEE